MAIFIRKSFGKFLKEIIPISNHIITCTLQTAGSESFTLIGCHMFPATESSTPHQKDLLYKQVTALHKRGTARGPCLLLRDFNAKALKRQSDDEFMIGPFTFDAESAGLNHQSELVLENRSRLVGLCQSTKSILANTFFQKPNHKLLTYRFKRAGSPEPPFTRWARASDRAIDVGTDELAPKQSEDKYIRYEQMDYAVIARRWRSALEDVETDIYSHVKSDHYPIMVEIAYKLSAINKFKKHDPKPKFDPASEAERQEYNANIVENFLESIKTSPDDATPTSAQITEWMLGSGDKCLPKIIAKGNNIPQDPTLDPLIEKKAAYARKKNWIKWKETDKVVKKLKRKQKRRIATTSIRKDLDLRSNHLGIKQLKQAFNTKPYCIKDINGVWTPLDGKAEAAAEILDKKLWTGEGNPSAIRKDPIFKVLLNTGCITIYELEKAIRKLKRRKATGTIGLSSEHILELGTEGRQMILKIFNKWWDEERVDMKELESIVILFKKGDSSDVMNYRALSLSNTLYKLYASIIKDRLASVFDDKIQATQYGFRANRSTSDAIHCIRRIMGLHERYDKPLYLLFVDWEKGFRQHQS